MRGEPPGGSPSPGWHSDPTDASVERYWDGSRWTSSTRPFASSPESPAPGRMWAAITAGVIGAVILVAGVLWWNNQRSARQLWSLLPAALGCSLDEPYQTELGAPPPSAQVGRVGLKHLGDDRLMLSFTFAAPPRTDPQTISLPPAGDVVVNAPGSFLYEIILTTPRLKEVPIADPTPGWFSSETRGILIHSPDGMYPWTAVPENLPQTGRDPLVSTSVDGRNIDIVLDLAGQDELLNDSPFTPVVLVNVYAQGPAVVDPIRAFTGQTCDPGLAISSPNKAPAAPASPTPAPSAQADPRPAVVFPPSAKPCPPKYGRTGAYTHSAVGNDQTSCPFAEEVRISYADMGNPGSFQEIKVLSPVTQQTYNITCRPSGRLVTCTGGESALV